MPLLDPAGHLLFHRNGKLMRVAFDAESGEVGRRPTLVADDVEWDSNNGMILATVSHNGAMVMARSGVAREFSLGWLTPDGDFDELVSAPGYLWDIGLSHDERFACIGRLYSGSSVEVWIVDLERRTLSRLSTFGSDTWGNVFSPDGRQVVYANQDMGFERMLTHAVDGATGPQTLFDLKVVGMRAWHWSKKGEIFFYSRPRDTGVFRLGVYDTGSDEVRPLLGDESSHSHPALSPDGRWLAYVSDESGRFEVYVRPYPALNRKWQISTSGGAFPHWRNDGRQLIYQEGQGRFYAVGLTIDDEDLTAAAPRLVAEMDINSTRTVPDGEHKRFLCGRWDRNMSAVPYRYVSNWRTVLDEAAED